MKKTLILISLLFILTSCLSNKNQEVTSITETWSILEKVQDDVILPPNEKTTKTEEDFSKDLQNLLKTIEENEQK